MGGATDLRLARPSRLRLLGSASLLLTIGEAPVDARTISIIAAVIVVIVVVILII